MDLTRPTEPRSDRASPSQIWNDLLRALIGILVAVLSGLLISWQLQLSGILLFIWTFIAGPALLSAILVLLPQGPRQRRIVRLVGAMAGWAGFLWILLTPETHQWLLSFYLLAPRLEVVAFSVVALVLVTVGLIGADRVWSWLRGPSEPHLSVQP